MQPGRPSTLLKPTLDTKFHIDYAWWERSNNDLRAYLLTHLTPEKRDQIIASADKQVIDYVDPNTGEVLQLDELGLAIQEAADSEDFINSHISLVDSVFRVFLRNGNTPLSPVELAEITGRDAQTILKTVGGLRVYQGIRPFELSL